MDIGWLALLSAMAMVGKGRMVPGLDAIHTWLTGHEKPKFSTDIAFCHVRKSLFRLLP
jgi:hypothetical protein